MNTDIDKKLLNTIQLGFPLDSKPFSSIGVRLGLTEEDVIDRIQRLKVNGTVRLIGPVMNPGRLGYQTTLVAARIPMKKLITAGQFVSHLPTVSHCYQRDHDFNLWFTLALPVTLDIEAEVQRIGSSIESETVMNLPAIKTFKIQAYFGSYEERASLPSPVKSGKLKPKVEKAVCLSAIDRKVVNALQRDLPLTARPFESMAGEIGMEKSAFLDCCRSLIKRGIVRRFSASVNHYKLGSEANAMVCWKVPEDKVNSTGTRIAGFTEVSHCYERQTNSLWPYNLFAMVHANNRENCGAVIDRIYLEAGLNTNQGVALFSVKEIKKTRVIYKV